MRLKRILTAGLVALALPLAGCGELSIGGGAGGAGGTIAGESAETRMAFQLATSTSMLSSVAGVKRAIDPEHERILDTIEQAEVFFLNTVDSIQVVSGVSDRAEYEHMETVTYAVSAEESETLTFYYNSFERTESEGFWETETEIYMRGVLATASGDLPFYAEEESETDRGEEETSFEVTVYTGEDRRSYVRSLMETEYEDGEYEETYEYTAVSMGQVVNSFVLDLEDEHGTEEKEVEIREGNSTYRVKMETRDGRTILKISAITSEGRVTAVYLRTTEADGSYTYERLS